MFSLKIGILQMPYSVDYTQMDELIQKELALLDACTDELDLIVAPEYSSVPCVPKDEKNFYEAVLRYNDLILKKAQATAKRANAILFINALDKSEK